MPPAGTPTPSPSGPAPASAPAAVCGDNGLLAGPSSPPAGAITVPAGNNAGVFADQLPANTTY
jgi:hypothetical protein